MRDDAAGDQDLDRARFSAVDARLEPGTSTLGSVARRVAENLRDDFRPREPIAAAVNLFDFAALSPVFE